MNDDEPQTPTAYSDGPLPNRITRGTLLGCLGLAGVMLLPLVLFLPFETWNLPRWTILLAQLAAFGALGGGIWLLAQVPGVSRPQSNDPLRPLTARGLAPVRERPATQMNRLGLAAVGGLLVIGAAGFAVAAFGPALRSTIAAGMALVSVAGLALAIYGVAIAVGKWEPPAVHWVRSPATPGWLPQGGWVMLIGLTLLAWALFIAVEAQLIWGAIGLVVLLVAVLLVSPAFRRMPRSNLRLRR